MTAKHILGVTEVLWKRSGRGPHSSEVLDMAGGPPGHDSIYGMDHSYGHQCWSVPAS